MASRIDISIFISLMTLFSPLENDFLRQSYDSQHFDTVHLSSLLPSSTCSPSETVLENSNLSLLEVVHKYGPCSDLHHDDQNLNLTELYDQILRRDKLRAEHTLSLFFPNNYSSSQLTATTTLPVNIVENGGGIFSVQVELGTPAKTFKLEIDSGSDLLWTQCEPCPSCNPQIDPRFNPAASSSYSNVPCSSPYCSFVAKETQNKPGCSGGICTFRSSYFDTRASEGYLAQETLTLSPSIQFRGFVFGCAHTSRGFPRAIAGLMGLARGKTSIVEQTASQHKRIFSTCLPRASSSSPGYLIFGGSSSKATKPLYTPMLTFPGNATSVYGVKLEAVTIAGVQIPVPTLTSTFIDSGFTLSVLPPSVYSKLKAEFRKQMAAYTLVAASGDLDTCYNLINVATVKIPKISLSFGGGVVIDLPPENILYGNQIRKCLAFYGLGEKIGILGNLVQTGIEVVHDIAGARIGFVPNAC